MRIRGVAGHVSHGVFGASKNSSLDKGGDLRPLVSRPWVLSEISIDLCAQLSTPTSGLSEVLHLAWHRTGCQNIPSAEQRSHTLQVLIRNGAPQFRCEGVSVCLQVLGLSGSLEGCAWASHHPERRVLSLRAAVLPEAEATDSLTWDASESRAFM